MNFYKSLEALDQQIPYSSICNYMVTKDYQRAVIEWSNKQNDFLRIAIAFLYKAIHPRCDRNSPVGKPPSF